MANWKVDPRIHLKGNLYINHSLTVCLKSYYTADINQASQIDLSLMNVGHTFHFPAHFNSDRENTDKNISNRNLSLDNITINEKFKSGGTTRVWKG